MSVNTSLKSSLNEVIPHDLMSDNNNFSTHNISKVNTDVQIDNNVHRLSHKEVSNRLSHFEASESHLNIVDIKKENTSPHPPPKTFFNPITNYNFLRQPIEGVESQGVKMLGDANRKSRTEIDVPKT